MSPYSLFISCNVMQYSTLWSRLDLASEVLGIAEMDGSWLQSGGGVGCAQVRGPAQTAEALWQAAAVSTRTAPSCPGLCWAVCAPREPPGGEGLLLSEISEQSNLFFLNCDILGLKSV